MDSTNFLNGYKPLGLIMQPNVGLMQSGFSPGLTMILWTHFLLLTAKEIADLRAVFVY